MLHTLLLAGHILSSSGAGHSFLGILAFLVLAGLPVLWRGRRLIKSPRWLGLAVVLLTGLPTLAHASEVGHIMDSVFSLLKVAVGFIAVVLLAVFLIVYLLTRK